MQANTIYLDHPLIFNHSNRAKTYSFIINKFRAKLTKLKVGKLNHACRLVYINSVLATIPIYYVTTILFSNKFISKINAIMRKFWWSETQEQNESTVLNFRAWKDICRPKKEGGRGIRDLGTLNRSRHGRLLQVRILSCSTFSKPNITPLQTSGRQVILPSNPPFGLP